MRIPDIKKYITELGALLAEHDQAESGVQQITAVLRAADASGDHQQELALVRQRQGMEKQLGDFAKAVSAHARTGDVEAARVLDLDLRIRVKSAMDDFNRLRAMLADFEFKVETSAFAPEPAEGQAPQGLTRAAAEAELDRQRTTVDKRVELASRLVPDRPVVLL